MATLADAGALVALLDRGQSLHAPVVEAVRGLKGQLVTTCPAFTEAMYLVGRVLGHPGQRRLWQLCGRGALDIDALTSWDRAEELMEQYRDIPMALADASLVALAEQGRSDTVLTLDRHFYAYRIKRGQRLHSMTVIPQIQQC